MSSIELTAELQGRRTRKEYAAQNGSSTTTIELTKCWYSVCEYKGKGLSKGHGHKIVDGFIDKIWERKTFQRAVAIFTGTLRRKQSGTIKLNQYF